MNNVDRLRHVYEHCRQTKEKKCVAINMSVSVARSKHLVNVSVDKQMSTFLARPVGVSLYHPTNVDAKHS